MKSSHHNGRRRQRPPVERSPLALAIAQADALRSRESLRAERIKMPAVRVVRTKRPAKTLAPPAAQRAQFAAAIARSEFGRFYFKREAAPAPKGRRPERNGKG